MDIGFISEQLQKIKLSSAVYQSLFMLQLSALDLETYIQERALENPLLDVDFPLHDSDLNAPSLVKESADIEVLGNSENQFFYSGDASDDWGISDAHDFALYNVPDAYKLSLSDYLSSQLRQSKQIDEKMLNLCLYLVNCMDERGYMDCPLEEIAEEVGCSVYDVEQALFAIQMLDPPGVGARNLSECLVLQLSQSSHFNALTVHIAQEGLFLLASHNYAELSKRLHTTQKAVRRAADIIASLNPIPSRGFGNHEYVNYCIPDASIYAEHGQLVVELNRRVLPQVSINREYCALLDTDASPEIQQYVRENFNAANKLIEGLQKRSDTLEQLLKILVAYQRDFFLNGGDILPIIHYYNTRRVQRNLGVLTPMEKHELCLAA